MKPKEAIINVLFINYLVFSCIVI